ncbi:TPA: GNAT family N-acetyltransferase [Legionella pneumophila]|uniref:GNAT family N-acetyltransferase n=1 Tax=Legionellaceae TaxID=444 RepID=UPI0005C43287|nr:MULTISPECIES: GNAT family N-acetyltransferase [Legionellaceae]HAT8894483.1 GNAT family N-acetyltransferase [Legionella pneumophila subsp. pneumophila]MCW8403893.1 acetyltransferase [Legionella pneumophila]MCW8407349.1 acetyltransferase [Legionella pneumophila]MCW8430066.1 acetyltransferase [Legionella pneumophila]MCW8459028.1 acetyltransferase [Legionella pneumophila]
MTNENLINSIYFEKVTQQHQKTIFSWLAEPHMQEFWDNSQEHKDDIITFINGRVTPSNYFNGIFTYWVGVVDNDPFCLILTAKVNKNDDCPEIWQDHISTTGATYSIDFGIGNIKYLGKKLATPTLKLFTKFFQEKIDPSADTFFIDPAEHNPRAKHVYEQAGFKMVGGFEMDIGVFKGEQTHLMVKKLPKRVDYD